MRKWASDKAIDREQQVTSPKLLPCDKRGATTPNPSCCNLEAPLYLVYTHLPILLHLILRPQHYNLTQPKLPPLSLPLPDLLVHSSLHNSHHFLTSFDPITSRQSDPQNHHLKDILRLRPSHYTAMNTALTSRVVNRLMLVSRLQCGDFLTPV